MSGKRWTIEGVQDVAPQDPRGRAKAKLPESQDPAVQLHTPRHHTHCGAAVPNRCPTRRLGLRTAGDGQ